MRNNQKFLQGGGELGALIRQKDWSQTVLGDPDNWPESLRNAVSISLNSGFPIGIYWGKEFKLLYNDAWKIFPGDKHPWCLGQQGAIAWPELWDEIGPQFQSVLDGGPSVREQDALLFFERYGYPEEVYVDYTLSPIIAMDGKIGGIFNAAVETTYKVINERRNGILLNLLKELNTVHSIDETHVAIKNVIDSAKQDIPFAIIYASNIEQGELELNASIGIPEEQAIGAHWPFHEVKTSGHLIENLEVHLQHPVSNYWPEPCSQALIVPLTTGDAKITGYLVAGVSARKRLDHDYQHFLEAFGLQIGAMLNNGYLFEQEKTLLREQALNEELAATNEELSATNEELNASRESLSELNASLEDKVISRTKELSDSESALQSLNEELTAINEELESTNEELFTTNEQLSLTLAQLNSSMIELEASETRFRFMLNSIPQQVWTAKPDGVLDYVNQVITKDFGKTTEEVVGEGWQAFIHPDDLPGCLKAWVNSLETGEDYTVEFRLRFKNEEYYWHLSRATPLIEDGKIKLWLGTNTNIELQKEKEQKKDEFISIASHELKTPLTGIKAYNQLMQRTADAEKLKNFINKSADNILRLEKLISDLLDVTKINAGKMNYVMEPFNFRAMLLESIENVQHITTTHEIVLGSAPEVTFKGDQFRLEQVMNNFLTNAVKYSPGGQKVYVDCKLEQNNIIVSVRDEGIGIEKESLDKLFDRYYRVDNSSMRFEGLGLGLFISSEILKRHYGSFWIESDFGKGSTFFFRLPLDYKSERRTVLTADDFYSDNSISLTYNKEKHWIEAEWVGFQNLESVQNGCMLMLDMLQKNKCTKVLNDNSKVVGTWSEAADWGGKVWFPMMEKAGLKHFAWIYSPDIFSQLSANKSVDVMEGNVVTQFFTTMQVAIQWLEER